MVKLHEPKITESELNGEKGYLMTQVIEDTFSNQEFLAQGVIIKETREIADNKMTRTTNIFYTHQSFLSMMGTMRKNYGNVENQLDEFNKNRRKLLQNLRDAKSELEKTYKPLEKWEKKSQVVVLKKINDEAGKKEETTQ